MTECKHKDIDKSDPDEHKCNSCDMVFYSLRRLSELRDKDAEKAET